MLSTAQEHVQLELRKPIGLGLATTSRAANMRGFHLGELRPFPDREVGEWVLHVQCPWRIEAPDGVLTGWSDLWEPAEQGVVGPELGRWDYGRDGNLQDLRIAEWLGRGDPRAGSCLSGRDRPVVLAVRATPFGGAEIDLSDGHRLTLFPAGSVGEDWRLFRPDDDTAHFVVAGGRVDDPE